MNASAEDGANSTLLNHSGKPVIVQTNSGSKWIPLQPVKEANGKDLHETEDLHGGPVVRHGFSLGIAIVFIIGECAGSGVLALPRAMADMGWVSVGVMIACCLCSSYSGVFLGRCWIILEERWDEYQGKVRYPYPAIGQRAVGNWMRYLVSFSVNCTLFGVATVYLLLCAQMVKSLLGFYIELSFCYWILIFAAILAPLMWLGTPEDFWPSALGALLTTAVACVLLVINIVMDGKLMEEPPTFPPATFSSFFLSFGTILFTFGGAAAFPTFQNDMKDRSKFPTAVIVGFIGLLILYMPVSVTGYAIFGGAVDPNVVMSISRGPIRVTVDILLVGHFFFAFLILINPTTQEIEDFLKVPKTFNWKRCVVRVLVMCAVVFVAESIPQFGKILSLVGGSTVTLTSYIFPAYFYMKLCSMKHPDWPDRTIPMYEKVYLIFSIIMGAIGGAIATYSAVRDIIESSSFSPPCYVSTGFTNSTGSGGFTNSTN